MMVNASVSQAYYLSGAKWSGQPASPNCCGTVNVDYAQMLSVDITGWDHGRSNWINSKAQIYIYHGGTGNTMTLTDTNDSTIGWDGYTSMSVSGGYFVSGTAYLNYYFIQNYSWGQVDGVATHELGHVIGLAHNSSGCVIMTPYTSYRWGTCGISTPQTDDVNGINSLY